MSKQSESWNTSLALRERTAVVKLLAKASKTPWSFRDVGALTRDLAEIDLAIARHRSVAANY